VTEKKKMYYPVDAIGSIAYYLKCYGWKRGILVAVRVSYLGKRYNGKKTVQIPVSSKITKRVLSKIKV